MEKMSSERRILVTGGHGFIGGNFVLENSDRYKLFVPTRKEVDITDIETIYRLAKIIKPDLVINFAAYRNANDAERERGDLTGEVWKTNVLGVRNLAMVANDLNWHLIHVSTDMVFAGTEAYPGPYSEYQVPEYHLNNLSWYGKTKQWGEQEALVYPKTTIVRIGNISQPIKDPRLDYVGKICYLFERDELYRLFDDQQVTLTSIEDIFRVLNYVVGSEAFGVFHVANNGTFSPFELANFVLDEKYGKKGTLKSGKISEYLEKYPYRYPQYGGLLTERTEKVLGVQFDHWKVKVRDLLSRM
jgi:dTDP-4-dehydrorhamnose reductase